MAEKTVSRIAPTPSGFLHIGNVFNFLLTWLHVRSKNGYLYLRIDDLDESRVRLVYIDQIFKVLDWLGIDYDGGPQGTEDFLKNHRQRYRIERYSHAIEMLQQTGKTFLCKCSRKEILKTSPSGQYPGTCKASTISLATKPVSIRIDTANASDITLEEWLEGRKTLNLNEHVKDFIIQRKDGLPAYQIASLLDDVQMQVNHIVRGKDLLPSSFAQMYLAQILEMQPFMNTSFHHHELLRGANKKKLSKSAKADPVLERYSRKEVFSLFAEWKGWQEHGNSTNDMLDIYTQSLK